MHIFDPEVETGFLMEALRRTVKQAGPEVPVLGFAASPWTLACYMVEGRTKEGFATVKNFLYSEPKVFRELLHKIAHATILYLKSQIPPPPSPPHLLSPPFRPLALKNYTESVLPAVQEIISGLGKKVPVIYYPKASHHLLPGVVRAGANVLSVDWRIPLAEFRKMAGPRVALKGNLDPAILFAPAEKIRQATLDIAAELSGHGHILNLGHAIMQHTPVENAQLFIHTSQQAALHQAQPAVQMRH